MTKIVTRANLAVQISAGCKSFCCGSAPCVSASRGGEYPTGLSCARKYEQSCEKVCENLLGGFARSFSVVFVNQLAIESGGWYLLRSVGEFLEFFKSRVCANARDVEGVLFSCDSYGGGWGKAEKIPVLVNLRRDDNVLKRRKRTWRLSSRFQEDARDDAETEK